MNINLTLIGQSITFLVFVWFCWAFVWTAIRNMMQEREQKIAGGLEAADRAGRDLELAQEKAAELLREAKQEATEIIEAANKRALQIIEESKDLARDEGKRLIAAANAEIERDINRAKEQLRAEVAGLVFTGVEKVLQASVDKTVHKELVEKLAANL